MIANETLNIKIGLSRSSDHKEPEFKILFNNKELCHDKIKSSAGQIEYFEFTENTAEGPCSLEIEFLNKSQQDTILDKDGKILNDLLLNIESIEIDEIQLNDLLWTNSKYIPKYPTNYSEIRQEFVTHCVNLGWNGRWIFPFTSPFYIWLLENI